MKAVLITLLVSILLIPARADDPRSAYFEKLERVRTEYRKAFAASLKQADKVTLFIVSFDDLIEGIGNGDPFNPGPDGIRVSPYGKKAKILGSKKLSDGERTKVIDLLAGSVAKPDHTGGAFCHYPIHGIRVHKADEIIHEGTFCWECANFSFDYPEGSDWLDTNPELEALFAKLMPIPQEEIDRFHRKFPALKPKDEQAGTGQPATRPESKSEGGDKPQPESEGLSR